MFGCFLELAEMIFISTLLQRSISLQEKVWEKKVHSKNGVCTICHIYDPCSTFLESIAKKSKTQYTKVRHNSEDTITALQYILRSTGTIRVFHDKEIWRISVR